METYGRQIQTGRQVETTCAYTMKPLGGVDGRHTPTHFEGPVCAPLIFTIPPYSTHHPPVFT